MSSSDPAKVSIDNFLSFSDAEVIAYISKHQCPRTKAFSFCESISDWRTSPEIQRETFNKKLRFASLPTTDPGLQRHMAGNSLS